MYCLGLHSAVSERKPQITAWTTVQVFGQGTFDAHRVRSQARSIVLFILDSPHHRLTTVSAVFQWYEEEDMTRAHQHCCFAKFLQAATWHFSLARAKSRGHSSRQGGVMMGLYSWKWRISFLQRERAWILRGLLQSSSYWFLLRKRTVLQHVMRQNPLWPWTTPIPHSSFPKSLTETTERDTWCRPRSKS